MDTENSFVLVMAPGGGKTKLIADIIDDSIKEGMNPDRIYAATFTREAAGTIRDRTTLLVNAMTTHSLAYSILKLFDEGYKEYSGENSYDHILTAATKHVKNGSHMDIDLLCIDEAQDLDLYQYEFLSALASTAGRVIIVGDPDQSIYGFRGGSPNYMDKMALDLGIKVAYSEVSRRLPSRISKYLNRIYNRNIISFPGLISGSVTIVTESPDKVSLVHRHKAYEIFLSPPESSSGILFRTNAEVSGFVMSSGKPKEYNYTFDITEHPFFALVSYNLTKNKSVDFLSLLVLARYMGYGVYMFERFISDLIKITSKRNYSISISGITESIKKSSSVIGVAVQSKVYGCLINLIDSLKYYDHPFNLSYESLLSYLKTVKEIGFTIEPFYDIGDDKIISAIIDYYETGNSLCRIDNGSLKQVMTVHASKGLEFDKVIYLLNPRMDIKDPEEFRIAYVAMSRAKSDLFLYLPYCKSAIPDEHNLYHSLIRNAGII